MITAGLWQRLDDRINPIVVKELRQAVQSRFVSWVVLLFLLLQLLYVGIHLFVVTAQGRAESIDFQGGREVFTALQVILLGTCMLFLPLYTAIRLAAERNEVNTDLLFITTLKPRKIISGKIVSAIVLALLIFSACTPFMLFTFFLRGIDWPSIVFIITIDFLVVIASVQLMVFLAVVPANRVLKAFLGLVGLNWLVGIFSMTLSGTLTLLWTGITPLLEEAGFWMGVAAGVAGILGACGLLFTWSVALVSPPSSNRAFGVRLYLVLFWLASGILMAVFSYRVRIDIPLGIWFVIMSVVWTLQLMISINERQYWTPRVARSIPRSWLLRWPAFFLFSGSAGGVLYASAMMGLTALAWVGFRMYGIDAGWLPGSGYRYDAFATVLPTMGILFLYTLCYGLTAVVVRERLLPRVPASLTWLIMILLVAFFSLMPFILGILLAFRDWRYETHYLWLLGNPAVAMMEFAEQRYFQHGEVFLLFTIGWACVVTVLNLPWLFRQVRGFQPMLDAEIVG